MRYRVIYGDPPWEYDDDKGKDPAMGGITYQTMSDEAIYRLPVGEIADADSLLFLWVTMPKLAEGLETVRRWGFRFITVPFVWVKQNKKDDYRQPELFYPGDKEAFNIYSGLGHWTNGNAELVLMGKRGHPQRVNKSVKQIVLAPVSAHSAKPLEVASRIVDLMGDVPRVELFARTPREGWDCIGNGIDGTDITESILRLKEK